MITQSFITENLCAPSSQAILKGLCEKHIFDRKLSTHTHTRSCRVEPSGLAAHVELPPEGGVAVSVSTGAGEKAGPFTHRQTTPDPSLLVRKQHTYHRCMCVVCHTQTKQNNNLLFNRSQGVRLWKVLYVSAVVCGPLTIQCEVSK